MIVLLLAPLSDFFTLTDHVHGSNQCREYWTDAASTSITVRMRGHEHAILHNLGCRGFDGEQQLRDFEQEIDELAGIDELTTTDHWFEERRKVVNRLGAGCDKRAACEEAAKRLTRDSLLMFELDDHDQKIADQDLVPFAQLTKRTFTRDEWNAIAKRLEYPDRAPQFADFRMLQGNVMLRVIVTP